ncbi:amino acid transporter [Luteococcus sp. H138]|uniref:amino acid transporter n=1 Tax=unclassified Luteococcus TaxID=2639923 RepID=UPI00313BCE8B
MSSSLGSKPLKQQSAFARWFLERDETEAAGPYENLDEAVSQNHVKPWYAVMCLTGVDYFSTLGYQPGIAAIAAGTLAPVATLVLVLITLFGALPMYRRVAKESPNGDGSLSMLEKLLSYWPSKMLVLALIGFIATGFIFTMTLSAADATAHLVENPLFKEALEGQQVLITLILLTLLGAVFLKGFSEAIGVAVVLVLAYLGLSLVVIVRGLMEVFAHPAMIGDWSRLAVSEHGNWLGVFGAAMLVFPALALGLSGFETGVLVMPQVKGDATDTRGNPAGRIRNAKKLLATAAVMMSVLLIGSSLATTLLIPPAEFQPGGEANGRALAYVAHTYLGEGFGTAYDVATIAILWFAGASAMAGLLNVVPRYLPRFGMAPDWAKAVRPLVVVIWGIAAVVTIIFKASVDDQAAAYATGVLALMTSAAVAVALTELRRRHWGAGLYFSLISAIFIYTFVQNVVTHLGGLYISLIFVALIMVVSIWSRTNRSLELRVPAVIYDEGARQMLDEAIAHAQAKPCPVRFMANKRNLGDEDEYNYKALEVRLDNHIPNESATLFLEAVISDASDFEAPVEVTSAVVGRHRILRARGTAVPNVLAAVLLDVNQRTNEPPHCYFEWSEKGPVQSALRFLVSGEGDTPPLVHEIIRRAQPVERWRPQLHVGG